MSTQLIFRGLRGLLALILGVVTACGGEDSESDSGNPGEDESVPPPTGMNVEKQEPPFANGSCKAGWTRFQPKEGYAYCWRESETTTPPEPDASVEPPTEPDAASPPDAASCMNLEGQACPAIGECTLTRMAEMPLVCRWDCVNPNQTAGQGLWPNGIQEEDVLDECDIDAPSSNEPDPSAE